MTSVSCFDNLILSTPVLTLIYALSALTICVLAAAIIWLLRQKGQSAQFSLLVACFIVADTCASIELHYFNLQMTNQCSSDSSAHTERKCLLISCFLIPVVLPADFMPYWGFAEKYWELSYRLESIINPFEKVKRPRWHKYLNYGVLAAALVMPFVFIACFALAYDYRAGQAWSKTYVATLLIYFLFFVFVLCLMGYLVYRFWHITNNSQYQCDWRLCRLNLVCYSIGTISAVCVLIIMTDNGRAFSAFALIFAIA